MPTLMEHSEQGTYLDKILKSISELHRKRDKTSTKGVNKSKQIHPRRKKLYRSFQVNNDTFYRLRASGIPLLTSYFMCDPSNMTRVRRQIQEQLNFHEKNDALSVINNI